MGTAHIRKWQDSPSSDLLKLITLILETINELENAYTTCHYLYKVPDYIED